MKSSLMKLNHVSTFSGEGQIVTFHPKSEPDIESMIAAYGFEKKALNHRPVRSLGLDIDRQLDGLEHPAPVIEDFKKIALTLIRDGAEVIIPGCLFISPILVKGNLTEIEGVPVLDVISISIKLAEFMNEMTKAGLPIISRRGLYQSPHKNLAEEVRGYFLK
jgi:allantoin racemase